MELALYCPGSGYYEKETDTVGKRGDFITSVSIGPVFGQLLAFQFARWLADFDPARTVQIVEAGAHHGQLALDILAWLRERKPKTFEQINYWIIEPSPNRQALQQRGLADFAGKVEWAAKPADIPGELAGIVFSNELLDAIPVHRLGWDSKRREWFEWGVARDGDRLVWARIPLSIPSPRLPDELLNVMPDGFILETSPAAEAWWREAAQRLRRGKLLTFDYGLRAEEFLSPQRQGGTLRAYHQHHLVDDVLANPGEQDLTAHVNFTAIETIGHAAGLRTDAFQSQSEFLTGIVKSAWEPESGFGPWTPAHTRQFQTLTHPEHLGRAFRALVQSR